MTQAERQQLVHAALEEASNRDANLQDVINALKAITMDMQAQIKVLHATVDFLTQLNQTQNAQTTD